MKKERLVWFLFVSKKKPENKKLCVSSMVNKVCAARKSKANPNVFTKQELIRFAVKEGLERKEVAELTKEELCYVLGIKWKATKATKATKARKETKARKATELIYLGDRACNTRKTKGFDKLPLTKNELVPLAVKNLRLSESQAKRMTKDELCSELESVSSKITVPQAKQAPKKTKKTKRKVTFDDETAKEDEPQPSGDCISRSKLKPHPHQIKLAKHMRKNRGAVAVHSVGSGKTLTAVIATQCFLDDNPSGKVTIVTPVSLQGNFVKELKAYGAKNLSRYEFYTKDKFVRAYRNNPESFPSTNMLVIDEAHFLRTDVSKLLGAYGIRRDKKLNGAAVFILAAKRAKKVLLLTATPIYNRPSDILNLAAIVRGEEPMHKKEFLRSIANDPVEMARYMRCVFSFYDRPKSEMYPEVKEHKIRIVMSPEYYRKYRHAEVRHLSEQSGPGDNPWIFFSGLRQNTNYLSPCQKCEWVKDKLLEGEKSIVYSAFKEKGVQQIQTLLDEENVSYFEISGSVPKKKRDEIVKKFNSDDNQTNVLFITKAGGEGLDLKGVRNVILLEKGWNRPSEEQIIGRAARYKSHTHLPKDQQKVDVYHLTLVKPANKDEDDAHPSADAILEKLSDQKIEENEEFLADLKKLSIENTNC